MKCLVGRVIFPTQHLQLILHSSPMIDRLTMLSQREQLMEDIDCIITSFFDDTWGDYDDADCNQLIEILCNSVCNNFPAE